VICNWLIGAGGRVYAQHMVRTDSREQKLDAFLVSQNSASNSSAVASRDDTADFVTERVSILAEFDQCPHFTDNDQGPHFSATDFAKFRGTVCKIPQRYYPHIPYIPRPVGIVVLTENTSKYKEFIVTCNMKTHYCFSYQEGPSFYH